MDIIIWFIIATIIISPYIVFNLRRKSGDAMPVSWGMDWISLLAVTLGFGVFGHLMSRTMTGELNTPWMLLIFLPFLILGILMLTLPRKILTEVMRPVTSVDERVAAISSKSARNALLVNYLALLVIVIIDRNPIDSSLLIILPGSGLLVFYSSYLFYFYARS